MLKLSIQRCYNKEVVHLYWYSVWNMKLPRNDTATSQRWSKTTKLVSCLFWIYTQTAFWGSQTVFDKEKCLLGGVVTVLWRSNKLTSSRINLLVGRAFRSLLSQFLLGCWCLCQRSPTLRKWNNLRRNDTANIPRDVLSTQDLAISSRTCVMVELQLKT